MTGIVYRSTVTSNEDNSVHIVHVHALGTVEFWVEDDKTYSVDAMRPYVGADPETLLDAARDALGICPDCNAWPCQCPEERTPEPERGPFFSY